MYTCFFQSLYASWKYKTKSCFSQAYWTTPLLCLQLLVCFASLDRSSSSVIGLCCFPLKKFSLGLTFIFDLSDWRYQAARRFVLINLISHMCAHWLNLNVSGISVFHFICIPFLFCCGAKVEDRNEGTG